MTLRLATLSMVLFQAFATAQSVERFHVADGRLFARIGGEDRLLSAKALRGWAGWTPNIVIYSERADDGYRLRWYNSYTRDMRTLSTEAAEITDVITVRLSNGNYALLIGMQDRTTGVPWVALATPDYVFHRESHAALGTAANDAVEVRRYEPSEIARVKGDLSILKPAVIAVVPLALVTENAAGLYEATLPAADAIARTITLNLRTDGSATLISAYAGKGAPVARKGTWKQDGAVITAEFGGAPMSWIASAVGLTPHRWDRGEWGIAGLPLRRSR